MGGGDTVAVDAGETVRVTLRYRVTDCRRVPTDPPAIPPVVRTPSGLTRTVDGPDGLAQMTLDDEPMSWTQDLRADC